jgi:sporulation protein YlmC with PRC-barrel domain
MMKIKKLSEVIGKRVFTDGGDIFGVVEEINILDNKIDGWRIVISRDSGMMQVLGGARGIIVPHQFIKAIGDVVVINRNAVPVRGDDEDMPMMSSGEETGMGSEGSELIG